MVLIFHMGASFSRDRQLKETASSPPHLHACFKEKDGEPDKLKKRGEL